MAKKVKKQIEKEVQIQKVFVGRQMVKRSEARLLRKYNIRECQVKIEPNYQLLSQQWLDRTDPMNRPAPQVASTSNTTGSNVRRRASIGSFNLFEVNGVIREVGFDHLVQIPIAPIAANLAVDNVNDENIEGDADSDSAQSISSNLLDSVVSVYSSENDENDENQEGAVGGVESIISGSEMSNMSFGDAIQFGGEAVTHLSRSLASSTEQVEQDGNDDLPQWMVTYDIGDLGELGELAELVSNDEQNDFDDYAHAQFSDLVDWINEPESEVAAVNIGGVMFDIVDSDDADPIPDHLCYNQYRNSSANRSDQSLDDGSATEYNEFELSEIQTVDTTGTVKTVNDTNNESGNVCDTSGSPDPSNDLAKLTLECVNIAEEKGAPDLVEIQTDDTSDVLKMPRNGNEAGGGDELESTDSKQCGDSVESSGNVSPTVDKEEDKLLEYFVDFNHMIEQIGLGQPQQVNIDDDDGNGESSKCDKSESNDADENLADLADAADNINAPHERRIEIGVPGAVQDMFGSRGRSIIMDPFRRGVHVPFNIYGRRRSISVFPTVSEEQKNTNFSARYLFPYHISFILRYSH